METGSFRAVFTGEEVLNLLDMEGEDGGIDDHFFPGSDEEFGMQEEKIKMCMKFGMQEEEIKMCMK